MFSNDLTTLALSAKRKANFLKDNPLGYFVAAILAGMFVGFGVLVSFTLGSLVKGTNFEPFEKLLIGLSFSVALSLVVFAGAELFTGNAMVMTFGVVKKEISVFDAIKVLCVSYLGNLIGSLILSILFILTGSMKTSFGDYLTNLAISKQNITFTAMIFKGILCNILVCLAIWSANRTKNDSAKLILITLCILTFVVAGFEHSIANMTVFILPLLKNFSFTFLGDTAVALIFVTIGNIIGGIIFTAVPYIIISKEKTKDVTE